MSYGKEQIKSILLKLRQILNMLDDELPHYWWLSQGEAPLVPVRVLIIEGKELRIKDTPKLTLKAAVLHIMRNLEKAQNLKGRDFRLAIKLIEEDLGRVTRMYSRIKEANDLIKRAESMKRLLSQAKISDEARESIKDDINKLILWIRDIFMSDPKEFDSYKDTFNKLLMKIEEKIKQGEE